MTGTNCEIWQSLSLFLERVFGVTELVGLDISDLDFDNGAMRVIRKGGNEDIVYFGEEVEEMLRNYLDERLLMEPEPGNEKCAVYFPEKYKDHGSLCGTSGEKNMLLLPR